MAEIKYESNINLKQNKLLNASIDLSGDNANTLSNVTTGNFASGIIVTEVGATGTDTTLPTEKAVRDAIDNAQTRVDDVTIERVGSGETSKIQLKDGGITVAKLNDNLISKTSSEEKSDVTLASQAKVTADIVAERSESATLTNKTIVNNQDGNDISNLNVADFNADAIVTAEEGIAALASASDSKLPTEKAVRALRDAYAGATETFTNKTFDANGTGNSIKNLEVDDFAKGVVKTEVRASGSATDANLASEKAIRSAIEEAITSGIFYGGKWTINSSTTDFSGMKSTTDRIKIGTLRLVEIVKTAEEEQPPASVTIDGITFHNMDHVYFKKEVAKNVDPVKTDFDVVCVNDSDIVLKDLTQTLTNKTINADNNSISDLEVDNLKSSAVQTGSSSEGNAKLATKSYVDDQITAGETHADEVTIHSEKETGKTWKTFSVKDGSATTGITVAKMNTTAVSTAITLGGTVVDTKLATEKAVNDAIIAEETRSATLTTKTIDATANTISNLKMTNLASANAEFGSEETTAELKAAAKVPSLAKVNELISSSEAKVDGVTIDRNSSSQLEVKDGGLTVPKFNADAIVTAEEGIAALASASDSKLPTEKAVRTALNTYALVKPFTISAMTEATNNEFVWSISETGLNKYATIAIYDASGNQCFAATTVTDDNATVTFNKTDSLTSISKGQFRAVMTGLLYTSAS